MLFIQENTPDSSREKFISVKNERFCANSDRRAFSPIFMQAGEQGHLCISANVVAASG